MVLIWQLSTAFADDWTVLQTEQVHVQCRELDRGTECEASARFSAEIEPVVEAVRDLGRWPAIFESVRTSRAVAPDTWAVEVRLPFPMGTRRFTAHVLHDSSRASEPWAEESRLVPTSHTLVLTQVAGESGLWSRAVWQFTEIPGGGTRVSYTWQTSALSALPGFVRRPLLRRTGHNTVWGVAMAAGTRPETRPDDPVSDAALADEPG